MADQRSLITALDKLAVTKGRASNLPATMRSAQSTSSPVPQSSILGEWEQDRFGKTTGSGLNPCDRREQQPEGSTVSAWRAFAQSNTSKPLSVPRHRQGGNAVGGVWRRENWRAGGRNEGARSRAGDTGPKLPTLPTVPSQGQTPETYKGPTTLSQQQETVPAVPRAIDQNQALRKRKSDKYLGHNGDTTAEEPQPKRASPDRPSPLSAAAIGDVDKGVGTAGERIQRQRRPSFERWVSSRARSHLVAPNGTTIIPAHSRSTCLRQTILPPTSSHLFTQNGSTTAPESQARISSN